MAQTRRERLREETRQEIEDTARRQMAAQGTASISLRAIAQEMGMTAPALYRYYTSRDDLLTALILNAFNALADALVDADKTQPTNDYPARLLTVMLAFRQWALTHSPDFQLIYGNPVPGYEAPREITVPASTRSFVVIGEIIGLGLQAGAIHVPTEYQHLPETVEQGLRRVLVDLPYENVPPVVIYLTMTIWTRLYGLVMLELYGHTPPVVNDPEAFYRQEVEAMLIMLGLASTP